MLVSSSGIGDVSLFSLGSGSPRQQGMIATPRPVAASSRRAGNESALATKLACGRLSDIQVPTGEFLSVTLKEHVKAEIGPQSE